MPVYLSLPDNFNKGKKWFQQFLYRRLSNYLFCLNSIRWLTCSILWNYVVFVYSKNYDLITVFFFVVVLFILSVIPSLSPFFNNKFSKRQCSLTDTGQFPASFTFLFTPFYPWSSWRRCVELWFLWTKKVKIVSFCRTC